MEFLIRKLLHGWTEFREPNFFSVDIFRGPNRLFESVSDINFNLIPWESDSRNFDKNL